MYVFWANCQTNMDGIIHELLTMNWIFVSLVEKWHKKNVKQISATRPKRLSLHWGFSRKYTTHAMQTSKQRQRASCLSDLTSPAGSTDSFQSPSFIPHDFQFSPLNSFFLLPVPFSYAVLLLSTAAASLCQSVPHINMTFLGFCKITPSTILLVILLYRQTEETFQTLLNKNTDMDSEPTNYESNLHIKKLKKKPHKIVYSLLILVVYAKMHKFQSQYVSLTMWQTCT